MMLEITETYRLPSSAEFDVAVLARDLDPRGGDNRRQIEFAKQRAKPHELVVIQPLAAKPQHEMVGPSLLYRGDRCRR